MITLHEPCRAAGAKPSINQLPTREYRSVSNTADESASGARTLLSTGTAGESAAEAGKSRKPKSELEPEREPKVKPSDGRTNTKTNRVY